MFRYSLYSSESVPPEINKVSPGFIEPQLIAPKLSQASSQLVPLLIPLAFLST